eukprot:Hpha_TRINITY_DN18522_c0_g1::TRINITY_DN18522_c0_g1_i1::g.195184::m.195184
MVGPHWAPPQGSLLGPPRNSYQPAGKQRSGGKFASPTPTKSRSPYRQGLPLSRNPLHSLHMSSNEEDDNVLPPITQETHTTRHHRPVRMVDVGVQASQAEALAVHAKHRREGMAGQARGEVSFWSAMDEARGARLRALPSLTNTPRKFPVSLAADIPVDVRGGGKTSARAAVILQEVGKYGIDLARRRNQKVEDVGVLGPMLSLEQDEMKQQTEADVLRGLEQRINRANANKRSKDR